MATKSEINTLAELAALDMAVHRILTYLAKASPDSRLFLAKELELGLDAIGKTHHWSVSHGAQKEVIEIAKARYADIIGSIRAE